MQSRVTILFHQNNQILYNDFGYSVTVNETDGNSCAIAAAKLLIRSFGSVDITKTSLNTQNFDDIVNWEAYNNQKSSFRTIRELEMQNNPHFYIWTHFFCAAPIWEIGEHTYYIIELTEDDLNYFPLTKKRNMNQISQIEKVILDKEHLQYNKTILFICVKDFDQGRYHAPKQYIDTIGLFNGIYRRKQERWLNYNFPLNQIPNDDILQQTDAIIIPGSTHSVYDDKLWIKRLQNFIINVYNNYQNIKIMGICFGFQLLAQTFGGIVGPCINRKKYNGFYHYGNENIKIKNELFQLKCFNNLIPTQEIIINKAHGDIVQQLPDIFINYGTSKTARHEIIISKDQRLFGLQAHPEYTSQQILIFICALKAQEQNQCFNQFYEDYNFKHFVKEQGNPLALQMCYQFLKQ